MLLKLKLLVKPSRDKYAAVQDAVNAAKTPDAIKVALEVTP
jgi:hypothetical protein